MDKFLTTVSVFDWITPTVAFIQDCVNGPVSDFGIPAEAGWSRGDIKRLLKKHDIRVWGLMLNLSGDTLMFAVPQAQTQQTRELLQREGLLRHAPAESDNSLPSSTIY